MAGMAELGLGRVDKAIAWLRRAIEANRNYPLAYFLLAAALARYGLTADAREAAASGLALSPNFTARRYRTGCLSDNPTYLMQREQVCEDMLRAGVPDG
jgi:tetratricopeptide (TPR) repeat protein